jgi:hypothetical protein
MAHKFEFRLYDQTVLCSECGSRDGALLRCTHAGCTKDVCVVCAWGWFLTLEVHEHELQVVRALGSLCPLCATAQHYALFCAVCQTDVVCVPCHRGHAQRFVRQCRCSGDALAHKLVVTKYRQAE